MRCEFGQCPFIQTQERLDERAPTASALGWSEDLRVKDCASSMVLGLEEAPLGWNRPRMPRRKPRGRRTPTPRQEISQ